MRRNYFLLPAIAIICSGCSAIPSVEIPTVEQSTAVNAEGLLSTSSSNPSGPARGYNGIPAGLVDTSSPGTGSSSPESTLHFLNVGSGTCCLAVSNNGHILVIDTGADAYSEKFFYYLNRLAPSQIDIVITVADASRAGNAAELIRKYSSIIGTIVLPEYASERDDVVSEILSAVQQCGLLVTLPADGELFSVSDYNGRLYRPYTKEPSSLEASACVFSLYIGERQYVFAPGITGAKEAELISYHDFEAEGVDAIITAVGGDGSQCSNAWLEALTPSYCVFNTASTIGNGAAERLQKHGCGQLLSSSEGTMVFDVTPDMVSVATNIVDYDNSIHYVEETTAPKEFVDRDVYCINNTYHSSMTCTKFQLTGNFTKIKLSAAIERGYSACNYCINASMLEGYSEYLESAY